MEICPSARKHGVADADIEHATKHAMAIEYQDDGTWLYYGPGRNGAPLELAKVFRDGSEVVIHAMPIRRNHERLLSGYGALR
jgi:hypothetical protein